MDQGVTISVMEGDPPDPCVEEEEEEEGVERITFEVDEGSRVVLNEDFGEVQLIDLGDPSISQEVEVITVDNATERNRIFRTSTPAASSSRRKVSSVGSIFSSSPVVVTTTSAASVSQNIGHRVKTAPALLRNSRRFQSPDHHQQQHHSAGGNITIGGRQISSLTASQLPTPQPCVSSFLNKSPTRQFAASINQHASISNALGMGQSSSANTQGLQQAVVLDENGQETQEYVILAPTESGELQIIERGTREIPVHQDYFQSTEIQKQDGPITIQHQGQTIFICEDPDSNQAHVIEDEDGNLISFDASMSNLTYHLDEAHGFAMEESEIMTSDVSQINVSSLKLPKPKKKVKKPLQVIIGPDGKPVKKKGQTELRCMEKGCMMTCFNVSELRKHLHMSHSIHFDEETVTFTNDSEFKSWRENYERERMVSFIYRGGTKKIAKDQAVTYMICHRSGHYKPTMVSESLRKRKLKPQGSCKMGGYCTAGIKLLKNLDTGAIKMEICHTHYGHPLDSDAIPHLRVNPTLRKVILAKFQEGLSFTEVLAYIHHNPDRLEGLRLVDRRAVRNIFDTWKNPTRRSKKAQQDIDELPPPVSRISDQDEAQAQTPSDEYSNSTYDITELLEPGNDKDVKHVLNAELAATHVTAENSSVHSKDLPLLSRETENANSDKTGLKDADVDDIGPPTLVPVTNLKKSKRKDKHFKSRSSDKQEDDSDQSIGDTDISTIKMELAESANIGSYRLRPNRKVEVYKTSKPKKSIKSPEQEAVLDQTKSTSKGKVKDIFIEKVTQMLTKKMKKELAIPEEPPLIISETLEKAIDKLHNHNESGPTILLYKPAGKPVKYGDTNRDLRKDDFCVVLQTPVQRQLMQMFPSIICFEVLDGPKPTHSQMKLAFLMVLDEYREAIPVAWLVSNSVDTRIITSFFRSIRNECGELRVKYLQSSPRNSDAYRLWCSTFHEKPKSIQNDLDVKRDLKTFIWHHFATEKARREVWEVMESIVLARNVDTFSKLKEKMESLIETTPHSGTFPKKLEKDWFSKAEEWAMCYRLKAAVNIIGIANTFGKLKKFVSFKGTKNLNESFEHILKIGYDKCFLRSKRMFKGDQKYSQFLEDIRKRHVKGRTLNVSVVVKQTDEEWGVSDKDSDYTVAKVDSSCECKLLCKHCHVCVHMYLCDCEDYTATQIMCEHVHIVHCYRNSILDEPEFISGDFDRNSEHSNGLFGKFETGGTEENPGQVINIDAVLKAAGIFQRSDGLQPNQIVSITDADTQKVIYEQNPSAETSKGVLPMTETSISSDTLTTRNMTETEIAVHSLNLTNASDSVTVSESDVNVITEFDSSVIISTDSENHFQSVKDSIPVQSEEINTGDEDTVSEHHYVIEVINSDNPSVEPVSPDLEPKAPSSQPDSIDIIIEEAEESLTNSVNEIDHLDKDLHLTSSSTIKKDTEDADDVTEKAKDISDDCKETNDATLADKEENVVEKEIEIVNCVSLNKEEGPGKPNMEIKEQQEPRRSSRMNKPQKDVLPRKEPQKRKAEAKESSGSPKKPNPPEVTVTARRTSLRRK